jgi:hypothetical protein
MDRALIIRKPYIDLILDNGKQWEMRSKRTTITGRIGLIEAGSGLIVGEVTLIGCGFALSPEQAERTQDLHQVEDLSLLEKWCIPWWLENPVRYKTPKPYDHPKGAVTWVRV